MPGNTEFEITFKPDGTAEFQDIKDSRIEMTAAGFLTKLGKIVVRGHKHIHRTQEGVRIHGH